MADKKDWTDFGHSWALFCDAGLNEPGTFIELEGGAVYLIGDINPNAGLDDAVPAFPPETVVTRYKPNQKET